MRRQNEIVAVCGVGIDEVVQQSPLQTGAHAYIHPVACACQLHAPLVVDQAQILAQIHMVLGGEVKLMGLTEVDQRLIVLFSAGLQVGIGHIGQAEHEGAVFGKNGVQLLGILGNAGLQLCHLGKDGCHIFACLFQQGNLLAHLVLTGLALLGVGDQGSALLVQLQDTVDGCVAVAFLGAQAGLDGLGILFDSLDIKHLVFAPCSLFSNYSASIMSVGLLGIISAQIR